MWVGVGVVPDLADADEHAVAGDDVDEAGVGQDLPGYAVDAVGDVSRQVHRVVGPLPAAGGRLLERGAHEVGLRRGRTAVGERDVQDGHGRGGPGLLHDLCESFASGARTGNDVVGLSELAHRVLHVVGQERFESCQRPGLRLVPTLVASGLQRRDTHLHLCKVLERLQVSIAVSFRCNRCRQRACPVRVDAHRSPVTAHLCAWNIRQRPVPEVDVVNGPPDQLGVVRQIGGLRVPRGYRLADGALGSGFCYTREQNLQERGVRPRVIADLPEVRELEHAVPPRVLKHAMNQAQDGACGSSPTGPPPPRRPSGASC